MILGILPWVGAAARKATKEQPAGPTSSNSCNSIFYLDGSVPCPRGPKPNSPACGLQGMIHLLDLIRRRTHLGRLRLIR